MIVLQAVQRFISSRVCSVLAMCTALAVSSRAEALEHITLRNGFSVDCSHHEVLGERVRLYTSKNDANYQELAAADIASVETLPDPPAVTANLPETAKPAAGNPTLAEMRDLFSHSGAEHNIDVELLASIAKAESNFHADAVSRAGALGVMQLMPGTAHELGVDASRADQNIAGGAAYLDSLLTRYKNNLVLALAAYNAGPAAVARYHGVPPFRETKAYVGRVITEFNRRKTASLHLAGVTVAAQRAATN